MYQTYRDRAEFLLVYVREAHPTDGWAMPGNVEVEDPKTIEARRDAAERCRKDLGLTMPALVDDMADTANLGYAAWPERLYVVAKDGTIAYAGGMGPFRFSPRECEAFLEKHLSEPENRKAPPEGGAPAPSREAETRSDR